MNKAVREYMASLGRKGGKATGERKRRSAEFYAALARKGVEARARKRKESLDSTSKPTQP